jgi:hypothetical protein
MHQGAYYMYTDARFLSWTHLLHFSPRAPNQSTPQICAPVSTATTATHPCHIARVIIPPSTLGYLACISRVLAGASQLHSNDEQILTSPVAIAMKIGIKACSRPISQRRSDRSGSSQDPHKQDEDAHWLGAARSLPCHCGRLAASHPCLRVLGQQLSWMGVEGSQLLFLLSPPYFVHDFALLCLAVCLNF